MEINSASSLISNINCYSLRIIKSRNDKNNKYTTINKYHKQRPVAMNTNNDRNVLILKIDIFLSSNLLQFLLPVLRLLLHPVDNECEII